MCGAVILQTSKDGEKWVDDVALTNAFKETGAEVTHFMKLKAPN